MMCIHVCIHVIVYSDMTVCTCCGVCTCVHMSCVHIILCVHAEKSSLVSPSLQLTDW